MARKTHRHIHILGAADADRMAKSLHVAQKQISEIEKRTDMHIPTLHRQIEAMAAALSW